ncbi:oxidoreductase [Rhodococcus sp. 05-2254-5]|uniref:NADPH:quinone reductase n=1 Tax=unclassified Rhodococcus (in: high G+C Gram-positive bacteria) TaxID=192944 RepID=UPI000B9C59B3|nr:MULTISPECIES: NADPH:quinone reductase [unclassified Rhodococcus (in: high G+C Gram-positive bacteria)]OZE32669.1 oxidoreductase [Rhodococcus sp. 05-2254-5]OZE48548.1 oxidoreductase [Rhodococcus sp. 05-2254-1]
MIAAWYDSQGNARDVLRIGEIPTPDPGPGDVRVRLSLSSVNPGDTKKRRGWLGSSMPYPRVVPHSDGAGYIDAVGEGVERTRVGERVWVFGAQSNRAFGTAAQYTVVPDWQAVELPDSVESKLAACLGIPGITAHRAVFGDGEVAGQTVLVHGVLGGVGSLAAQLARWNGATVIGTVRTEADADLARAHGADHVVVLSDDDAETHVQDLAVDGVDRIVEVSFSDNVEFDAAIAKNNTVIAAYGTREDRPSLPFWPMLFDNITIRLLGSDDFSRGAKSAAAVDLTEAASTGALSIAVGDPLPLDRIADGHDRVDAGTRTRVLLQIPE